MTGRSSRLPVVVVISGNGSNLQALIDASRRGAPFEITTVISNRADAAGLARAEAAGIARHVLDHREFGDRSAFDAALAEIIEDASPALIVLAGFMRILTDAFVERFCGRMINIHPSLLPAFQGLHTHRRALQAGVGEHGASVHFVTPELDGGPVIAQTKVAIARDDDERRLAARVLAREHQLLPQVVSWFADGRLRLQDGRVLFDGHVLNTPLQC